MSETELEMLLDKVRYLSRSAEAVVFAGSLPRGVDDGFYADAVRELARRGVRVALDTEGEPLRLGLEAEPWLVSPNQHEAEQLVGQELFDEEDFLMALDTIAEMGARNVHITLENGCFALVREERQVRRYRAVTPQLEPVSVVGAGDAFLAQWLTARARRRVRGGRAPPRRRQPGPRPSSRSVPDASIPRRPQRLRAASRCNELAQRLSRARRVDAALLRVEATWSSSREDKFAKEGLTFDDVLLVPAESAVLPNDVVDRDPADARRSRSRSRSSRPRWTPSPRRASRSRSRARAGSAIVHRNLSIERPGRRGRQGEALASRG